MKTLSIALVTWLALAATEARGAATLTLDPLSGGISGAAGSIVGWGFALADSTDYAVITSSNLCLASSGVGSACIAPTLGIYTDYIASNFIIAGPAPESTVVSQVFNSNVATGVGSFTINASAPAGATDAGQVVATYDLFSADPLAPNFDPAGDLISAGNYLMEPASVTVTRTIATPEPSYVGLVISLASLWIVSNWRMKQKEEFSR